VRGDRGEGDKSPPEYIVVLEVPLCPYTWW